MKILCIGDIVGTAGVSALGKALPLLKGKYSPDIIIANGENAGDSISITAKNAEALFGMGVDVITGGNHSLRCKDMEEVYESRFGAIRPANMHSSAPGEGVYVYEKGKYRVAVVNLIGNVFLDLAFESPFLCIDRILRENDCKNVVVDFHAEATSEKIAMGKYLNGRASLVYGTHTHVPTADEEILSEGTAYITDIGMTGPSDSVIGIRYDTSVQFLISHIHNKMEVASGECKIQGIVAETDDATGKAVSIERFDIRV